MNVNLDQHTASEHRANRRANRAVLIFCLLTVGLLIVILAHAGHHTNTARYQSWTVQGAQGTTAQGVTV